MNTSQKSAAKHSCSDDTALLRLKNGYNFHPSVGTEFDGFPWSNASDVLALHTVTRDAVSGYSKPQFSLDRRSEFETNRVDVSAAFEKRFLIFDRSGDKTTMFFSPVLSSQAKKTPTSSTAVASPPLDHDEKSDENHFTDEESGMEQDSDGINALLYSDSDENSDEDEVTSKEHFPLISDSFPEQTGKDASAVISDYPHKRRRLLCPVNPNLLDNDAESNSCAHDDDTDSRKVEKTARIRRALKLLEIILPDMNTKDPLSIINEAIFYLKSMKAELGSNSAPTAVPSRSHQFI